MNQALEKNETCEKQAACFVSGNNGLCLNMYLRRKIVYVVLTILNGIKRILINLYC